VSYEIFKCPLYLSSRFAYVLVPHEIRLRIPKIIEWVGHFFGLKVDGHLNGSGEAIFDPCCCLNTHDKLADISKMLVTSMTCLENTAGIALITDREICLLRPGSFAGRPFGLQSQKCCTQAIFHSLSVIPKPFRTTVLQWDCAKHGKSTQNFGSSLHSWCMAGQSGHIARWSVFLPPPKLQACAV